MKVILILAFALFGEAPQSLPMEVQSIEQCKQLASDWLSDKHSPDTRAISATCVVVFEKKPEA